MNELTKVISLNNSLNRGSDGAREGVGLVCLPVIEGFRRSAAESITHTLVRNNGCDGCISTTQTLPKCDDIRNHVFLFKRKLGTRTTSSTHDFVENQENTVLIADGLDGYEVACRGGNAATCRTDDGLCNECHHCVWTESQELTLQLTGKASNKPCFRLTRCHILVCISGTNMADSISQDNWKVRSTTSYMGAKRQRSNSIAVKCLCPGNEIDALWLSFLDKIVSSQLDGYIIGLTT